MATNNFLPFAPTDTGTNLLTQVEYAAAADRTIGNQPGVASSKLNNKALRQASFIVSQLAQYLADKTSVNVLDDGNTAALLAIMNSAFAPMDQFAIENLSLVASVGSSALTIAVKTQAAANPSITDQIFVGMRSATLTSGAFNRRNIQAALSMVVSSGSTLGQTSGQPSYIWVYLIDNAGTLELAVSHSKFSEDALVSTTAEGGAGAADSATVMYSTTARSNVPCRLIGYILNTQATAGTWASTATEIQLLPSQRKNSVTIQKFTTGSGTYNTPAGCTRIRVRLVGGGGGGAGSASGAGTGGSGNNTTFGTTLLVGSGGVAGQPNTNGGGGGAASLGGADGIAIPGGTGGGAGLAPSGSTTSPGGNGGNSAFGGGGGGGGGTAGSAAGTAGATNSGSGGGGASAYNLTSTNFAGGGGGAGGYVDATIVNPLSSYAYAVGAASAGGTAGASGNVGGGGAAGIIVVEEFYD